MKIVPFIMLCLLIVACYDKPSIRNSPQTEVATANSHSFVLDTLIDKNLQVNFTVSNSKLSFNLNGRTIDTATSFEISYDPQINTTDPIYGIDINDVEQRGNRISLLDSLILFSVHSIPELGFNKLYVCSFKKNTAGFVKTYYQKKTQENVIEYQSPYYFIDKKSKSFFLILQDVKDIETNTGYTPVYKYKYIDDSVKFDRLVLKLKPDSFYNNSSISEMLKRVK